MADKRNRLNVIMGAPDVEANGGIEIGLPATKASQFPDSVDAELTDLKLKPAGYIAEDGITKTVDRTTEKIKDWATDPIKIVTSEHSVTLHTVFMEAANAEVLKMVQGEKNVKITDGKIIIVDNREDLPNRSIRFRLNGGNGTKIAVFAPDAQVTSVGDVKLVKKDVIRYDVKIECFDVAGEKLRAVLEREGITAEPASDAS